LIHCLAGFLSSLTDGAPGRVHGVLGLIDGLSAGIIGGVDGRIGGGPGFLHPAVHCITGFIRRVLDAVPSRLRIVPVAAHESCGGDE
jgi:hypothetical protein